MTGPRLIDWTGERAVPWTDDLQVMYEHLHRYHWAAQFTTGGDVLDLASGEGYGAAILAAGAATVTGLELDADAVAHSRATYATGALRFEQGSMLDRSAVPRAGFDVVTCFEALEHVSEHSTLLEVALHALRETGLLIVSTPDRDVYTDELQSGNPFHVRELNRTEFVSLLKTRFEHVALWGQSAVGGSLMVRLPPSEDAPSRVLGVRRSGEAWSASDSFRLPYLVAVASRAPLPPLPGTSTLIDTDGLLLRNAAAALHLSRLEREVARLQAERDQLEATAHQARTLLAERSEQLSAAVEERDAVAAQLGAVVTSRGWRVLEGYRAVRRRVTIRNSSHR